MQKVIHISLPVILSALLFGCMHTVIGDGRGTLSPDGRFTLAISSHGASRKAYVDKSKKKVWIWIGSPNSINAEPLFQQCYVLNGSDIQWQTHWSSAEAASVEVYDWGDGVSNYDNMHHLTASNHIALLLFILDKNTGKFVEQR